MVRIWLTSLVIVFFSFISASSENIDGFDVEDFPNDNFISNLDIPNNEIRYGQSFLESDDWQVSPLSQIDVFAKSLMGQSLFSVRKQAFKINNFRSLGFPS